MTYPVAAGIGGTRLGPNWPVAALATTAVAALDTQRDGQLRADNSRQVTRAAFALVALTAAAAASQLADHGPLNLPSLASVQAALTVETPPLELTSHTAALPAPAATPTSAPSAAVATVPRPTPASTPTPAAHPVAPAPATGIHPSPTATVALTSALAVRGTPYVWGGASTRGFDCSGLVQWAYRKAGVALPRTSQQQSRVGVPVSRDQLRPGDLVFFYTPVHHVGIYMGNGQVLNAPQTGDVVRLTPLNRMPFHNARRVI
ncbi:C40 family peptidase [Pseudonocardia spinosispora]|uniref:C40 family peptidase n=1 Tax=Pseudonocardia spinosispora TaxID=103441 RepID=UPI000416A47E|nr:NlpC/P60 family protein [Pseudonocardia spinosispora]